MSRSNRNWPGGILRCSQCPKTFKQAQSLANHVRICKGVKTSIRKQARYPAHFQKLLDEEAGLAVFFGRPSALKLARRLLEEHRITMVTIEPYRRGYAQRSFDLVHAWAGKGSDGRNYASTETVSQCVNARELRIRTPAKGSKEETWGLTYIDAVVSD